MERNKYLPLKMQSIFKGKTNNTLLQLFRYTVVGGLAFLVDFGTLFFLTEFLNIHYLVSAGISFVFGLTINYILSVQWVFSCRIMESRLLEFFLFALIGLVGLGLTELFLWILTDILFIYYLLSKILTAVLVYFWNFFVRKLILFNQQKS